MPVTITGSKYGARSISSVSDVNRVVVSTTPFLSADFLGGLIGGRIVALWSSGAAAFKGVAWVRRFVSTNTLELEGPFIDPATGAAVAQAVGDVVHVSRNWAEVAQAGVVVDNERVTVTDSITWGTAGVRDSVCFYDEGVHVRFASFGTVNTILGGCVVQGHLEDYATSLVSGGCKWTLVGATGGPAIVRANSEASGAFLFFGGSIDNIPATGATSEIAYLGARNFDGTDFSRFLVLGTQLYGVDLLSRRGGGVWDAPQNHIVRRCTIIDADVNNGILSRWGNGVADGITLKVMRFASSPISIYGSDAAGTFAVTSPADTRTTIRDVGNGNVLWRSAGGAAQVVNYTNIVSPTQAAITGQPLTQTFSFQDTISNLVAGSRAALIETATGAVAAQVLNSGSSWAGTVEADRTVNGSRPGGYPKGPWKGVVKRYGYAAIGWAFAAADVSLGPAGTAKNVTWTRSVIQLPNLSVTMPLVQASAITGVALDFASRTVTVTTSRSLTDVYHFYQYVLTQDAGLAADDEWAFAGGVLNAGAWAVVVGSGGVLSGGGSVTTTSTVTVQPGGVLAVGYTDATGARLLVSVPGLVVGTRIQLYNTTTSTTLLNAETTGDVDVLVMASAGDVIRLRADHAATLPLETTATITAAGLSFLVTQAADDVYAAGGVDGATVTEFSADGSNIQIDIDDPDGVTSVQRLYAWMQYYQTTAIGIASPFFGAMTATDAANFVIDPSLVDIRLDNVSSQPLRVVGGYLTRKDGSTIIASTSGSIQMDPGKAYVAGSDSGAIASAVRLSLVDDLTTINNGVKKASLLIPHTTNLPG